MSHTELHGIRAIVVAAMGLIVLAGCASDPRYQQGLEWVVSQEAERKRLNDAGFPQYSGSM